MVSDEVEGGLVPVRSGSDAGVIAVRKGLGRSTSSQMAPMPI